MLEVVMNYSVSWQQIIVMKEWDELHEICLLESCNLCHDEFSKILFFSLYTSSQCLRALSPLVVVGVPWPWVDSTWTLMLWGRYIMRHYVICYLVFWKLFQLTLKYLFQDVDALWNPRVPGPRNNPEQGSQQGCRLVVTRHPHLWNVGGVREPSKSVYT